jgi:hypothetical protein
MPARDIYHQPVKQSLIKDGWTITADPYKIKYKDAELFADLAAEKIISAERRRITIIVEIKSFVSPSPMKDLELAIGQYIIYRNFINLTEPDYQIYLAITDSTYNGLFQRESVRDVVKINQVFLVVVDIQKEKIKQWIN